MSGISHFLDLLHFDGIANTPSYFVLICAVSHIAHRLICVGVAVSISEILVFFRKSASLAESSCLHVKFSLARLASFLTSAQTLASSFLSLFLFFDPLAVAYEIVHMNELGDPS